MGGYAQGKLNYVLRQYGEKHCRVWDGEIPETVDGLTEVVVVDHFHNWIKANMLKGRCPEKEVRMFLEKYPDCVIISDEIGNGIVPSEAFEREYRERTGRLLVELAQRATEVVRVICGIGQKIK